MTQRLVNNWVSSISTPNYLGTTSRATLDDIQKRTRAAVEVIISSRSLLSSDVTDYLRYFRNYFVIRQLHDDLADYDEDRNSNTLSFAAVNGIASTRNQLKNTYMESNELSIPLFYKNLLSLYYKYFFLHS